MASKAARAIDHAMRTEGTRPGTATTPSTQREKRVAAPVAQGDQQPATSNQQPATSNQRIVSALSPSARTVEFRDKNILAKPAFGRRARIVRCLACPGKGDDAPPRVGGSATGGVDDVALRGAPIDPTLKAATPEAVSSVYWELHTTKRDQGEIVYRG
ncbi:hypothetical protein [Streptomyces sp. NPDC002324]